VQPKTETTKKARILNHFADDLHNVDKALDALWRTLANQDDTAIP
jgi:hypothetical protein